ncbi:MAG: dTDP-4-dehydrorhamnose 3,5-epimerase, partial [Balneolaceae bacterium]
MNFLKTDLDGVYIVEPLLYRDERGYFLETYRDEIFREKGLDMQFVQDNCSFSKKGVVRGLHYQARRAAQEKLIMVCRGEILDVAVDLRRGSPTFGKHISVLLSEKNHRMVLIPGGFAHGFSVLSEEASVYYKCSTYYDHVLERGIRWNDPDLKINWK